MASSTSSASAADEGGMIHSPLISQTQRQKGGLITMPFIIGTIYNSSTIIISYH